MRRRRIADQPRTTPVEVHTIMEEPEEEEKQEIEPCNYENLFETVGGHRFYRRTRPPLSSGSSPLSSLLAPSDGAAASFAGPGHSLSTVLAGPIPIMNEHEFREEGSDHHGEDNDHDINPRSLLGDHQHGVADRATTRSLPGLQNYDRNSFRQDHHYESSSKQSLAWSQFKAILSKNFKLYNSVDIYLLALLIIVGMLIIPYQCSFVKEAKAKSYHSWDLKFPGSFGFLKSQRAHFWIKLITGNDQFTEVDAEQVVNESFGSGALEELFGQGDDGDNNTTNVLYHQESKATTTAGTTKEARKSFHRLQDDLVQMGRRLMRHPVPTPSLDQYIKIYKLMGLAKEHFNQTNPALGTLHIATPSPEFAEEFADYLITLLGEPRRVCRDDRTIGCDVHLRVHETSGAAMDFIQDDIEPTWALFDFTNWNEEYVIRMDPAALPSTPVGESTAPNSDEYQLYLTSGFLTLQKTIDEYAFVVADRTAEDSCYRKALRQTMVSMPMPTHAFVHNTYLSTFGFMIGLACIAALLAPIARLVLAMVSEKEAKLQAVITVAGVPGWLINLSWLSFAMIVFSAISLSVAVLLKLSLLSNVAFWRLAIWMACSGASAASFAFVFGIIFEQAKLSAALAPALFLATALPRFIVFGIQQETKMFYHWVALFPGSAICFGVDSLLSEHGGASSEEMIRLWRVVAYLLLDSLAALTIGFLFASVDVVTEVERLLKSLGIRTVSDDGSVASHASTNTPVSIQ
jgi:hypothetical protein